MDDFWASTGLVAVGGVIGFASTWLTDKFRASRESRRPLEERKREAIEAAVGHIMVLDGLEGSVEAVLNSTGATVEEVFDALTPLMELESISDQQHASFLLYGDMKLSAQLVSYTASREYAQTQLLKRLIAAMESIAEEVGEEHVKYQELDPATLEEILDGFPYSPGNLLARFRMALSEPPETYSRWRRIMRKVKRKLRRKSRRKKKR